MGGSRFRFRVIFGWIRGWGVREVDILSRLPRFVLFYFVDELIDEF